MKTIEFTQPEMAVSIMGGIGGLTPILVNTRHEHDIAGFVLFCIYVIALVVFAIVGIFLARRKTTLEVTDGALRHGKRVWEAGRIRSMEWNAKYRRIMIRAHKGFGLGMTLVKETAEPDAECLTSWAASHGIPIIHK